MKKKILVVDDQPDIAEFLKKRLEANNLNAISAVDGEPFWNVRKIVLYST